MSSLEKEDRSLQSVREQQTQIAGNTVAPPAFDLKANDSPSPQTSPVQKKEDESGDQEGKTTQLSSGPEHTAGGGTEDSPTTGVGSEYKGIVVDIAKSKAIDFAWDYWEQLKQEYSLTEHLAELLERACLYLIDEGLRITGIGKYLSVMNPYLEILKAVKTIIETIPPPIRTFIGYAIGWGIKKFSDKYMWGAIKEKHLNFMLIEGADFAAKLGMIIDFLYDLGHNPVQTIYKGIWAAVRYFTGEEEIDSMTDYLNHLEDKAKDSTGYSGPRSGDSEKEEEGGEKEGELSANEKAERESLFNTDLGFFWVRMGMPKLERWNDEETQEERGGLAIDGGLGLKVFGNVMGSDDIDFRVPYSGDWVMDFHNISILSEPISLGNWFRGGPIDMPRLRLKSGVGVDLMHLRLMDFVFGNDVFVANELGVKYTAADELLNFTGDTEMNFFGYKFLGKFALDVGTDGEFKGGMVDIQLPQDIDIIEERLYLDNLNFIGAWGEGGLELLEIAGDIHVNIFEQLDFDAERAAIRWEDGEFMGIVNQMSVIVPLGPDTFVEVILNDGKISQEGFEASQITLKFSYGDEETQEENEDRLKNRDKQPDVNKEDLPSIIPGFNMDWVKSAGVDTLVVSASANGVKLGGDGFSMDGDLEKKLHKFAAEVLGVRAEFDGDKNEGTLQGDWNYKVPNLPDVSFDFPILPGINAGLGIGADIEMGAELMGSLKKQAGQREGNKQPWELGGYAGLMGHAGVRANFDVSLGHPLLVSIHAGLFAEAGATMHADAALHGVINWDEDNNSLETSKKKGERPSASFDMHADLTAELGASVKARAFHIFKVTLWEYKFLQWEMGLWRAKGKLVAKEDGGYDFEFEQAGFDGGVPKRKPEVEFKVASTEEVIRERERKNDDIDDPYLFWRLVHDVTDPTQGMDEATRRVMLRKLERLNDTGSDLASYMGTTKDAMSERTDEDLPGYSYLMTPREWERYSTIEGFWGSKRIKKHKKIDRAIKRYHETSDNTTKKQILIDLVDNILPQYLMDGHNGDAIVAKLLNDAKRELKRVEAQDQQERDMSMAESFGSGEPGMGGLY